MSRRVVELPAGASVWLRFPRGRWAYHGPLDLAELAAWAKHNPRAALAVTVRGVFQGVPYLTIGRVTARGRRVVRGSAPAAVRELVAGYFPDRPVAS